MKILITGGAEGVIRRKNLRVVNYDYSQAGAYFITICAKAHKCILGKIENGQIRLNKYGEIVNICWREIPEHFPNVILDAFAIMPNHIHGIVKSDLGCRGKACLAPTPSKPGKTIAGSLPVIIGSFKSAVSKQINILRKTPGKSIWQRNYYEHIIRNENSLNQIRQYIEYNSLNWDMDIENPMTSSGLNFRDYYKRIIQ